MTLILKLYRFLIRLNSAWGRRRLWSTVKSDLGWLWTRWWIRRAGLTPSGRFATRLATWFMPPYYGRKLLAELCPCGYVSPDAVVHHRDLRLGAHIFIGDRVTLYQDRDGGSLTLGDRVHLYGDSYLQTGDGGHIDIGPDTHIQPRCQLSAYVCGIRIGARVQIAPNCAFYPYDHGTDRGQRIADQPLISKGDIVIDDEVWVGTGAIVLSGVHIGKGAVIGAGAVVTTDVPENAIATGVPARVVKRRQYSVLSPDHGEPATSSRPRTPPVPVHRGQRYRGTIQPPVEFHHRQIWSIGIMVGRTPLSLEAPPGLLNPVITIDDVSDVPATFVADPFLVRHQDRWYMFFEVLNRFHNKGEIALAISEDGFKWSYQRIVLAEPFHLSYPYVFEWQGHYYMIPESHQVRSIRLYRAEEFPLRWRYVKTLVDGRAFADSSICRHGGLWWLFTETNPALKFDTLRLYLADDLLGPWHEHPRSPIIQGDPARARPAGRIVAAGPRLLRFTQDCTTEYGRTVLAREITELTPTSYVERDMSPSEVLTGSGTGWNAGGMHHVDAQCVGPDQWLACVDGWRAAGSHGA